VLEDLRFACRGLWLAKTFTAAAAWTLAIGVAAATMMFAVIEGVLLRPLPVPDEDRVVLAWKEVRTSGSAQYPFGDTEIETIARASKLFETVGGVTRNGAGRTVMLDRGKPGYVDVALITGGFFDVLRIDPVLGRRLTLDDDTEGEEHAIVISSALWQRRYGSSRAVLGRPVVIDERPHTIVGVMPADLDYPAGVDVWMLTRSVPTTGPFGDAARQEINLIARLRPGVTIQQATAEVVALSARMDTGTPAGVPRRLVPRVHRFTDVVVGSVRKPLLALFGAVGLVLLIACANVSNLLLMRSEARRPEMAVRAALGAGPGRIVRQVVAESLVLAALAAIGGLFLAWGTLQILVAVLPEDFPRIDRVHINAIVVLFSVAVVFSAAALAGVAPAIAWMRADIAAELRSGIRGLAAPPSSIARRALVVLQVALAVTLVCSAGLLIRSVLRLQSADLGLSAERLVLVELYVPQNTYADRRRHEQFLDATVLHLAGIPAVAAATPVNGSPFTTQGWDVPRFTAEGQTAEQAAANPSLNLESIHPNYFSTFGIRIVRGRSFTAGDRQSSIPVAIVSGDVASHIWPGMDPIGRRLKMGTAESQEIWHTIVGVAATTRYRDVSRPRPTLYLAAAQFQMTATNLVLRTTAAAGDLLPAVRARLESIDPAVTVLRIAPFSEMLARPLARPRFNALVLVVFAAAALVLSMVGLHAMVASFVRQRRVEIAIRLALGANAGRVRRFVMSEVARLSGAGAAVGFVAAAVTGRLLASMLYEVSAFDPYTLGAAAVVFGGTSTLAAIVPIRRATRVDAVAVLKGE
jgi:putative ABC transport system permease protein